MATADKDARNNLETADIEYEDETGAAADFHAPRHSFVCALARGGASPKTAMELARHSDVNLTTRLYSHTLVEDRSEALATLPGLDALLDTQELRATDTEGKSDLRLLLSHSGQVSPIEADANRLSRTTRGRPGEARRALHKQHRVNVCGALAPGKNSDRACGGMADASDLKSDGAQAP